MRELLWNNPVSEQSFAGYVESLPLRPDDRVLDVGCGSGEMLLRVAERFRVQGVGVDNSAEVLEEAAVRRSQRNVNVRFQCSDAREFRPTRRFELAMCFGATHAFGLGSDAYRQAIESLKRLVRDGGLLLIGEGCMLRPASSEYRVLLGDAMPDEQTHLANVNIGRDAGLTPLGAWLSNDREWDDFEWGYQRVVEAAALREPDNEQFQERLHRRREWMGGYLRWGRDTLGFGVYLFRVDSAPSDPPAA